jgi:ubiquinone/menaquinone biosynthesis C-methylase UbiE
MSQKSKTNPEALSLEKAKGATKQNEELWDSRALSYDKKFGFTRWTQKKLVSILELDQNLVLLDLGCGTGWTVSYAANFA